MFLIPSSPDGRPCFVERARADPAACFQGGGEGRGKANDLAELGRALAGDEPKGRGGEESPIEECPLTPIAEQSPNGEATRPTAIVDGEGEGSRGGGGPGPGLVGAQQLGDHQGEQLGEGPGPGMVPTIVGNGEATGEGIESRNPLARGKRGQLKTVML